MGYKIMSQEVTLEYKIMSQEVTFEVHNTIKVGLLWNTKQRSRGYLGKQSWFASCLSKYQKLGMFALQLQPLIDSLHISEI